MVQMVVFINLFFVPMVCLYLIYQREGKPLEKSLELFFQYCIVTACNISAAKVFIFLIKRFTGMQISIDSGYYTVAALTSAVLLAWLFSAVHIKIVSEDEAKARLEAAGVRPALDEATDMVSLKKSVEVEQFMMHIAQLFLYTITANILLSELAFLLGRAISWNTLPLSFIMGLLCLILFYGKKPSHQVVYEAAFTFLLFLFLAGVCGKLFDFSADGNYYHKLAIGLLKNHWNPIRQLPGEMTAEVLGIAASGELWAECYAKGVWIFAAGVYGITGNIECGKVYTLISMICAFLLTYAYMRRKNKGVSFSLMFAATAALNPVAIQQMNTFYIDGYLHIMCYILVLSLVMLASGKNDRETTRTLCSITACAMIICGTTKFTGLLYGGVYCIGYFLYYCYRQLRNTKPKPWRNIGVCFALFALLAAVTVFWAGADCYVMNTIRHGSPVYPLYGKGAIDIITTNSPFGEVNHVKNLLISLFSKVNNYPFSYGGVMPQLKIPFTVDWQTEYVCTYLYDGRISGFGIFFSGILLIALAAIIVKAVKEIRQQKAAAKRFEIPFWMVVLAANVLLCLIITESWWARYAPYIYFVALMGLFFAWDFLLRRGTWIRNKIACVVLFALVLSNSLVCMYGAMNDLRQSAVIREELQGLKSYTQVETYAADFQGIYFNLKDQDIRYVENNSLESSGMGTTISYMGMQVLPQ